MASKTLKRTIRGIRFEWDGYPGGTGGEYINMTRVGDPGEFDVLNTTRPDGTRPDFNRVEFMAEIEDCKQGIEAEARERGEQVKRGGWLDELYWRADQTYPR